MVKGIDTRGYNGRAKWEILKFDRSQDSSFWIYLVKGDFLFCNSLKFL